MAGRTDYAVVLERAYEIERLIASGVGRSRVRHALTKLGVSPSTAERAIQDVLDVWTKEAAGMTREERRAEIDAMLRDVYSGAMTRTRQMPRLCGRGEQELIEVPDPDYRTACTAADSLARLHGVMEQPNNGKDFGDELIQKFQAFFGLGAAVATKMMEQGNGHAIEASVSREVDEDE